MSVKACCSYSFISHVFLSGLVLGTLYYVSLVFYVVFLLKCPCHPVGLEAEQNNIFKNLDLNFNSLYGYILLHVVMLG